VNSNPGRSAPNTATVAWPDAAPAARTVALACDIDRPRRSTDTSTVTGPAGTSAAKTVERVRSRWSGRSSSRAMAEAASAAMIPPWGTSGQFQRASTSTW
jgi:hypothetical protein